MSTLRELFERIQEVEPPEREAWIGDHCADQTVRAQLRALLQHQTDPKDPLSRPVAERLAALEPGNVDETPAERWIGRTIAAFRLTRVIGQGGMAVVFEAERIGADFTQRVAVKVLKRMVFSALEERLFRRERQALAALAHPNIARLIDGGIADDGTPFLAVEMVDGVPITNYCETHQLEPRARLLLFATVCHAVEAAHEALIVHRDIKPSNILVTAQGDVKLLDFGIAKLLDEDADPTRTGFGALTPDYAAPEQFAGGPVTTATDVYGLGVLLHELLVGVRPGHVTRRSTERNAQRAGGDQPPLRGAALRKRFPGDLSNIVLKALEHEPRRRYGTARALVEDIERHLAGQPVSAHPPSTWYRARKFVQRHRAGVAVTLALSCAVLISLASALWQAQRAEQQAALARQQSERAQIVRDFVVELVRDLRPGGAFSSPQSLLERAVARARERFAADDGTRAELLLVIGDIERGYGRLEQSRALLEEAAAIARRTQGPASRRWLDAEAYLGHTAFRQGRNVEGSERLQQALREYDAAGGVAGAARVRALMQLGSLLASDPDENVPLRLQSEAVQLARRVLPPTDPLQQTVLESYGDALANAGHLAEARPVLVESLARARALYGNRDFAVVSALEALAVCDTARGAPEAALPLLVEAQGLVRELIAGPHVMKAYVANSRGTAELRLGHTNAARDAFEDALAIFSALVEVPHPMLAASHFNLGEAAFEQQRYEDAAAAFEEAAAQREALAGTTAFGGIGPRCLAGEARAARDPSGTGPDELRHCIARLRTDAQRGSYYLAAALGALADAQWRTGDHAAAARDARDARSQPEAIAVHERLLPLFVLYRHALETDRSALPAHARDVAAAANAIWSRPCQTDRIVREWITLSDAAGDGATSKALHELAQRARCEPATPPAISGVRD